MKYQCGIQRSCIIITEVASHQAEERNQVWDYFVKFGKDRINLCKMSLVFQVFYHQNCDFHLTPSIESVRFFFFFFHAGVSPSADAGKNDPKTNHCGASLKTQDQFC